MAPNPAQRIDGLLTELAPTHTIGSQGRARFVAGPSGLFVVVDGTREPLIAADLAAQLAAATRTELAEHLSWVPFIDAVVVIHDDGHRRQPPPEQPLGGPALAVPLDLLGEVLVEGRPMVDESALRIVADLLHTEGLGSWQAGLDGRPAKIDLCEPTADTSATA